MPPSQRNQAGRASGLRLVLALGDASQTVGHTDALAVDTMCDRADADRRVLQLGQRSLHVPGASGTYGSARARARSVGHSRGSQAVRQLAIGAARAAGAPGGSGSSRSTPTTRPWSWTRSISYRSEEHTS